MRRADDPAARARARAWPLAALLAALLAAPPRPCGASNVFSPLRPGGDRGIHGGTGPHGRHGHSAVTTGRHVTVFGGRSEFRNGDFLNDLWVYDVDTGDWTAGSPNELVCAVCEECQSRIGNQQERMLCYDWTGLRPYTEPQLTVGNNRQDRDAPSGRYAHRAELVLNRASGQRDLMVMFGGYSVDCTSYCDDYWHYFPLQHVWTRMENATRATPPRRWQHATTAYLDTVFMFGGHGPTDAEAESNANLYYGAGQYVRSVEYYYTPLFDDLWAYNATLREWERLYPECTTCSINDTDIDGTATRDVAGPRARYGATLVEFDKTVYLFGGYAYGGGTLFQRRYPTGLPEDYPSMTTKFYRNDLWAFSIENNTWTEIFPDTSTGRSTLPPPRYGHAAAMSGNIMMVFGGRTWEDEVGDMWQYNISDNTWVKVLGEGEFPSRRLGATMSSVGSYPSPNPVGYEERMLIFGGYGCERGENYVDAAAESGQRLRDYKAQSGGLGADEDDAFDIVAKTQGAYGEKYCLKSLNDMWLWYPNSCPRDCSRHGVCLYNFCVCDDGFTGIDCSNVTCPSGRCAYDYQGHVLNCDQCGALDQAYVDFFDVPRGECDGYIGQCRCNYPASGADCKQTECRNDCNGVGECDKQLTNPDTGYGTCSCMLREGTEELAFGGDDCGIPLCINGCNSQGNCVNGTCVCYPGFGYPAGLDPLEDCSYVMFQFSPAAARSAPAAAALAALAALAAGLA